MELVIGVVYVDASALGTKQPAKQGQLIVLASGLGGVRERCEPIRKRIEERVASRDRTHVTEADVDESTPMYRQYRFK